MRPSSFCCAEWQHGGRIIRLAIVYMKVPLLYRLLFFCGGGNVNFFFLISFTLTFVFTTNVNSLTTFRFIVGFLIPSFDENLLII